QVRGRLLTRLVFSVPLALALALVLAVAFGTVPIVAILALVLAMALVLAAGAGRGALLDRLRGHRHWLRRMRNLVVLQLSGRDFLRGLPALLLLHLSRRDGLRGGMHARALRDAGRGRSLRCLLAVVLLHDFLARLVAVLPTLKHLLLLQDGISIA